MDAIFKKSKDIKSKAPLISCPEQWEKIDVIIVPGVSGYVLMGCLSRHVEDAGETEKQGWATVSGLRGEQGGFMSDDVMSPRPLSANTNDDASNER